MQYISLLTEGVELLSVKLWGVIEWPMTCFLGFFFILGYTQSQILQSEDLILKTDIRTPRSEHLSNIWIRYVTMTSWWVRLRLKSPAPRLFTQPFIQAQIKENIKAPCHWPLWGEFPTQRACNAANVSIWWRHHIYLSHIHANTTAFHMRFAQNTSLPIAWAVKVILNDMVKFVPLEEYLAF